MTDEPRWWACAACESRSKQPDPAPCWACDCPDVRPSFPPTFGFSGMDPAFG